MIAETKREEAGRKGRTRVGGSSTAPVALPLN